MLALLIGLGFGLRSGRTPGSVIDPTALHLLVVGWLTQMVFGVAFWLFPRYRADRPRGSEPLGWVVFGSLNLGLLLRVLAEPGFVTVGIGALLVGSGVLQLAAGLGFAINTWPRVKEKP